MSRRLPLLRTERTVAREILRAARTAEQTCVLVDAAHAFARTAIAEDHRDAPPAAPLACASGCGWCCYSRVVVTEAEVLRIVAYLRAQLTAAELDALRARVRAIDEVTHGQTSEERFQTRVVCPLLRDGACTVHEVRPLACVGYNSSDASVCERAWRDANPRDVIPSYTMQVETAAAVHVGMVQGVRDAGLRASALELNAALRVALEREGIAERWLEGRHPFAAAVVHDAQQSLDELLARVTGN
jgi:Fe-S-cluster containining protein